MDEKFPAANGHRLLIVDDEVNFLWSIARALRVKGYEVHTAESGEAALVELSKHDFDLVLTDIKMPGMDGFELVEWLRAHRPGVAVVMTTAFGSLSMRDRSIHLGALSYIEKPIDLPSLTEFLDRLFHSPGFAGRISDIDLLDYLQLIVTTHKTKIIQVTNRRDVGRLVFESGQLVHATCGERVGVPAFHEIVSWQGGSFHDVPFEAPATRSVNENTSYLLMEAARMRDERMVRAQAEATRARAVVVEAPSPAPRAPSPAPLRPASPTVPPVEEARAPAGPFARFRRFLDGLEQLGGVRGSVLLSREGLILARGGAFPAGFEPLIFQFAESFDVVGRSLELGSHERGALSLDGETWIHVEPVSDYLLGVWATHDRQGDEISSWVKARAGSLD